MFILRDTWRHQSKEGRTRYSPSNLGIKQWGFREHGMCGRLIKGKEKIAILWPVTADELGALTVG